MARREKVARTPAPKRRNAGLAERLRRVARERDEALEFQAATSAILASIRSSATDAKPVFDAIVTNVLRLLGTRYAAVFLLRGGMLELAALKDNAKFDQRHAELAKQFEQSFPQPVDEGSFTGKALHSGQVMQLVPIIDNPEATPQAVALAKTWGYDAMVVAPLLRDGAVVGCIGTVHPKARRFTDRELSLLKSFADHAVIAIENARLFNETKAALEQQTATADILKVISSSPTDLTPVFDAILESALQLCDAHLGLLNLYDGERFKTVAQRGANPEFARYVVERGAYVSEGALARLAVERKPVHAADLRETPAYRARKPNSVKIVELGGARSYMALPLLKDQHLLGAIIIYRREVRPFTEKQIALVSLFADQAVIAIENVRLFNETKEALERQTATAEILKVISHSPTHVQPVFDAVAANAARVCGVDDVTIILRVEDGGLVRVAHFGAVPVLADPRIPLLPGGVNERVLAERRTVHIPDTLAPSFASEFPGSQHAAMGVRALLATPLVRDDVAMGLIQLRRADPRPFTDKQIALLETFADQAVIAIENVRLFNETKEALEQQTAISEVLRVISNSPADVQPVLEAVAERAAKICEAVDAQIFLQEGDDMKHVARFGPIPIGIELGRARRLSRGWVAGRAVLEGRAIHVEDLLAVPREEYPVSHELRDRAGHRTLLSVPLMRERRALGAISLRRMEVRPFTEKQIALLRTFADQAAIAIENVRLFNETKEALDQQKASADVLSVISSSIADTQPVFDRILTSCERLFAGRLVGINLVGEDGLIRIGAYHGREREAFERIFPLPLDRNSATGRAVLERALLHYPNVEHGADVPDGTRRGCAATGIKACVFAPMLWEGRGLGAIFVGRDNIGEFSEKEIALLKTFADQAAIAIQNARLFREIQEKSAQLEVANKHKSDFLANMSHELRTPLNAIIGFSEALSDRMFGEVNDKQAEYLKDIHESGRHLLSLINDILDLSKIEAGRMELEFSTFDLPTALSNAMTLIRERAQRHDIGLGLEIDEKLGDFSGDERKFKQIMLNLLSNAVKFTPDGGKVDVSARKLNGKLEVAVRDTGIGIAPEDQAAVFEEFRQVGRDHGRKAEGTGLGLSLTKRFVELHGGAIRLESTPGKGSTFTVSLPLR